jgi:carbon-monoxide dehydrogenase large subunit
VRYFGEAVACVIAESVAGAKDGAEAVTVEVDPLPAVTDPGLAGAPAGRSSMRTSPAMSCSIFTSAIASRSPPLGAPAHVTLLQLRNNRIVVDPMEPRAALAEYNAEQQHWTLHVGCQGVFGFRNYIAQVLGAGRDKVRVVTDRVGSSFGTKQPNMPEYFCILHGTRMLGRPVKWTDERSGSFVSDTHGRDHDMAAELALDRDGNFLAVRLTGYGNLGATYGAPGPSTRNAQRNTLGVYKTPLTLPGSEPGALPPRRALPAARSSPPAIASSM